MNKKYDYPIAGELECQRLNIINKVFNSTTYSFLMQNGLKAGMKVLEIGCRTGELSYWLAQQVTSTGKVLAIDKNAEQLAIAKQTAKRAGLNNIEFMQLDVNDINTLKDKFDFIYGRAVVEFSIEDHKTFFKELYGLLNPQGILTYESISASENGHFSYPHQSIIDEYFLINKAYFLSSKMAADLPSKLYHWFREFGCNDIVVKANQPVLINREEKSIVRLGAMSVRDTVYKEYSDLEFENFIRQLQKIEDDDEIIIGFFRSFLVKGMKSPI